MKSGFLCLSKVMIKSSPDTVIIQIHSTGIWLVRNDYPPLIFFLLPVNRILCQCYMAFVPAACIFLEEKKSSVKKKKKKAKKHSVYMRSTIIIIIKKSNNSIQDLFFLMYHHFDAIHCHNKADFHLLDVLYFKLVLEKKERNKETNKKKKQQESDKSCTSCFTLNIVFFSSLSCLV